MRKVFLILSIVVMASLFNTMAFASVQDDQVTSQKIQEADGTSGQNTNSGSGVKTGHIQNGAVTPDKIGFYINVIVVALSGGDFTNPVDALNAITDASASNPYLVKIMPGVYDIGNSSVQMKPYVDIEGSGENATTITGYAMNSYLTFNGTVKGASSAEIRFLTVKSVSSGETAIAISNNNASPKITNITAIAAGASNSNYGIYNTSSSPIITNVTVTATGNYFNYGIYNYNSSSPVMNNVIVTASGGVNSDVGIQNANFSSPSITNVTVLGDDIGIANVNSSSPKITDVMITASQGVYLGNSACSPVIANVTVTATNTGIFIYDNYNGVVNIDHSVIAGSSNSIYIGAGQAYIGDTNLNGSVVHAGGTLKCVGIYDSNYDPYTCP